MNALPFPDNASDHIADGKFHIKTLGEGTNGLAGKGAFHHHVGLCLIFLKSHALGHLVAKGAIARVLGHASCKQIAHTRKAHTSH